MGTVSRQCPTMLKVPLNIDLSLSAMTRRRSPSLHGLSPLQLEETRLLSLNVLNPSSPNQAIQLSSFSESTTFPNSFSRPGNGNTAKFSPRLDDALIASLGLGHNNSDLHSDNTGGSASGSMILYRLTDDPRTNHQKRTAATGSSSLLPPQSKHRPRSEDSTFSFTATLDSTSPLSSTPSTLRGLVPYLYDPSLDLSQPIDDEDRLHDPTIKDNFRGEKQSFSWRGLTNMTVLLVLISALLCLFIFYPVWTFVRDRARNLNIGQNININGTGQAPLLPWLVVFADDLYSQVKRLYCTSFRWSLFFPSTHLSESDSKCPNL